MSGLNISLKERKEASKEAINSYKKLPKWMRDLFENDHKIEKYNEPKRLDNDLDYVEDCDRTF